MDILLRRIDASAIKIIDEKAKNNHMTRNELLKHHIEELAQNHEVKHVEQELNRTVGKVGDALEMTYQRLNQLEKQSKKMFFLLCDVSGHDPKEMNHMLDRMMNDKKKEG